MRFCGGEVTFYYEIRVKSEHKCASASVQQGCKNTLSSTKAGKLAR